MRATQNHNEYEHRGAPDKCVHGVERNIPTPCLYGPEIKDRGAPKHGPCDNVFAVWRMPYLFERR